MGFQGLLDAQKTNSDASRPKPLTATQTLLTHCTHHTAVHFMLLVKVDKHHVVRSSPCWCQMVPVHIYTLTITIIGWHKQP